MSLEILIAYTIFAFFYIISPGPAILLAIVNGIRCGMKTVVVSSLGNVAGLALLSLASALGLGLLMQTSALLFMVVKLVGVAYFIYLGIKFLRSRNTLSLASIDTPNSSQKRGAWSYFSEAFLIAATNPKPILFFTAIFPQFLDVTRDTTPQFALMTTIFLIISFCSLFTYGYLSTKSKRWLGSETRMKWFHRATGGLFIGLGVGLLQLKSS